MAARPGETGREERRMPRMERLKRRTLNADIQVVSISDIAFLLIIFFLVTTTMGLIKVRPLDLPATRESEKTEELKNITLSLKGPWVHVTEERKFDLRTQTPKLQEYLTAHLSKQKTDQGRVVIILADANVKWEDYVNVIELVKECNGIPTIQTEEIVTVRK